jgi:transposase
VVARGGRLQPRAGEKGGAETGPSPVDRARAGSKHHLLVDATGIPLAWTLTGGNRNDVTQLIPLLERIPPVRGRVGRPRRQTEHGSGLGRARWVVERTFAWLHHFKRLLVRYDRRAEIHEAFLALGCCLVCFRRLRRSF